MSPHPFSHTVVVPCSILTALALPEPADEPIYASREDEAIAIGCGLSLGGMRPLVAFQNSGLANSLNTLGSLAIAYRVSLTVLVTMRGSPTDTNPTQIPIGFATRGFLNGLGLPHQSITHAVELGQALHDANIVSIENQIPSFVLFEEISARA